MTKISPAKIIEDGLFYVPVPWRTKDDARLLGTTRRITPEYENNTSNYIIIQQLVGCAWLAAAYGNSPKGTPLLSVADPSPAAGTGNQLPSLNLLDVYLNLSAGTYMGKTGQNWRNTIGTVERPHVLASAIVLWPGSKTKWEITPDFPATCEVHAEILGQGYYVTPADFERLRQGDGRIGQ